MNPLRPHTTGLALGGIFAIFHFLWALLVLSGWAQLALDVVFRLHMLRPVFRVEPFSIGLALGLIVMTFVVGYALGWVFAEVWNRVQR
jgi:hypothetical protein